MMNKTLGKQICFDEINLKLLFLSPYVDITDINTEVCLHRFESDMVVTLPKIYSLETSTYKFINALRNGIDEEKLVVELACIVGDCAEDWLETCMLEGIIE